MGLRPQGHPVRRRKRQDRRAFLRGAGLSILGAGALGSRAIGDRLTPAEWAAASVAAFPFEHVVAPGAEAMKEWERLKRPGVAPVIIGAPSEMPRIAEPFNPGAYRDAESPPALDDVLTRASALRFPEDVRAIRETEAAAFYETELERARDPEHQQRMQLIETMFPLGLQDWSDGVDAPVGSWPETPPWGVVDYLPPIDYKTGGVAREVAIVLLPTDDPTTAPAHLRWGGWKSNLPAEYHVAALRSWRDRYGAELVTLSGDTVNLRVATRPQSRAEALDLAREHYWYCGDIISQSVQDLSSLAALLMVSDWWGFWWD